MKLYFTLVALLAVGCQGRSSSSRKELFMDLARNARIVNGVAAGDGEFPFMVSLQVNGGHHCGSTILNEHWILTAAHCVYGLTYNGLTVRVGTNNYNNGGVVHNVVGGGYHGDYVNGAPWNNDIAAMQVDPPIQFNDKVRPVSLPSQGQDIPGGAPSTAIGWGSNCAECGGIPDLQKVDLVIFSREDCAQYLGDGPTLDMVCSGKPQEGKGICFGDSGGPLIVNGQQVGITSWTVTPCAVAPSVWTRVPSYRDWIRGVTGV